MSAPRDPDQDQKTFDALTAIVAQLRGDDGCPWDKEQSHASLRKYLIEETYEVIDAIDADDMESLCEELGDVLFQVVFHAQIAAETGAFSIRDVVDGLSKKLIRRHPHVFADQTATNSDEVLNVWQSVKQKEQEARRLGTNPPSLMDGIPRHLPALMYAETVGKRASRVGFDWAEVSDVWEKVLEEKDEVFETLAEVDQDPCDPHARARVEEEWGDLMFALTNLARHMKIDPESAMRRAVRKFEDRFRRIERLAASQGETLEQLSLPAMDALWDKAKGRQELD